MGKAALTAVRPLAEMKFTDPYMAGRLAPTLIFGAGLAATLLASAQQGGHRLPRWQQSCGGRFFGDFS
jgi:hypothetical protein